MVSQGRFANGLGQEFAEFYSIHYWRETMQDFELYTDKVVMKTHFFNVKFPVNTISSPIYLIKIFDFAYFGNLGLSPSFWAFNFASNAPIESSVAYIQPCFRAFLYFTLIFKLFMGGSTPHEFDWEALLLHGVGYPL